MKRAKIGYKCVGTAHTYINISLVDIYSRNAACLYRNIGNSAISFRKTFGAFHSGPGPRCHHHQLTEYMLLFNIVISTWKLCSALLLYLRHAAAAAAAA